MMEEASFTIVERENVLMDIAHWKYELEQDTDFDHDDFDEYIADIQDLSDEDLQKFWYETVGEWALSRNDIERPRTVDDETWLDYQFGKLMLGHDTEYGFIVTISTNILREQ